MRYEPCSQPPGGEQDVLAQVFQMWSIFIKVSGITPGSEVSLTKQTNHAITASGYAHWSKTTLSQKLTVWKKQSTVNGFFGYFLASQPLQNDFSHSVWYIVSGGLNLKLATPGCGNVLELYTKVVKVFCSFDRSKRGSSSDAVSDFPVYPWSLYKLSGSVWTQRQIRGPCDCCREMLTHHMFNHIGLITKGFLVMFKKKGVKIQ